MEREQKTKIKAALEKKMVLLAGPRQAGKTTLAKQIMEEYPASSVYLSYDCLEDRKIIEKEAWISSTELLVLDEIHKMSGWKNFIKGVYDTKPSHQKLLVVGSIQLEVGDPLIGRYFLHRLMPLSPSECERVSQSYTLEHFLSRGGFPVPFLLPEEAEAERWRVQSIDRLLGIEVLEFESIRNPNAIRRLFEILRERVGSPISFNSIARNLAISPHTVKKYIEILEALYIVFRVTPFSRNIARSLLKEPKIYFFDVGLVKGNGGLRFENLVAVSLLKHVLAKIDYEAKAYNLHYLQTKEGHEVDFALVHDASVEKMIEVKRGDPAVGRGLRYFFDKYQMPACQVVQHLKQERVDRGIEILSGASFLSQL